MKLFASKYKKDFILILLFIFRVGFWGYRDKDKNSTSSEMEKIESQRYVVNLNILENLINADIYFI